jgi:DNA-binding transcriptional regulator YiaG
LISTPFVDAQISQALLKHLRLLLPAQIRAAREALGLQQEELARHLGVAAESLCRWEKGVLIQSRATDNLLRVYFAFPAVRKALVGDAQSPDLGIVV